MHRFFPFWNKELICTCFWTVCGWGWEGVPSHFCRIKGRVGGLHKQMFNCQFWIVACLCRIINSLLLPPKYFILIYISFNFTVKNTSHHWTRWLSLLIFKILFHFLNIMWIFTTSSSPMLEKAMAPHPSTLAWKIPWTEEPGGLQSMRLLRVRHDWATSLSLFTFMHWRRKWQPTPVFLPGESQGRGSLTGFRLWGRTESDTTEAT